MSALQEITNFVPMAEDIGTSGQPRADQFDANADAGYAAVINLALPTSEHAVPSEGSIVTGLGLGLVEGLTKYLYPPASATVVFAIMALVLLLRPAGLFGRER